MQEVCLSTEEIVAMGDAIAQTAVLIDVAIHRFLVQLREFDRVGGWHRAGALSCAHWLSWRVGMDLRTAREKVRVARRLGELPHIDDALRAGEISYSKVRAMTRVATASNERVLLTMAQRATGSQLAKICRLKGRVNRIEGSDPNGIEECRRYVLQHSTDDNMVSIQVRVLPDEAARIMRSFEVFGGGNLADGAVAVAELALVHGRPSATASRARRGNDARQAREATGTVIARDRAGATGETLTPTTGHPVSPIAETRAATTEHPAAAIGESCAGAFADTAGADGEKRSPPSAGTCTDDEKVAGNSVDTRGADDEKVAGNSVDTRGTDDEKGAGSVANTGGSDDERGAACVRSVRPPVEVVLHVSAADLEGQTHLGDGIPPDVVLRVLCDSGVVPILEDEAGRVIDVGRKKRTIPAALRRALEARDGGCRFPGCTNWLFTDGHHLQHWVDGGETTLANTVLLCRRHHRYLHEYGFTVSRDPNGDESGAGSRGSLLVFRDPDGRVIPPDGARPRVTVAVEDVVSEWAGRSITSEANAPGWDGEQVNYELCLDALRDDRCPGGAPGTW